MKKHGLRFLIGGLLYLLIELVWRYFMNHGTPSLLMAPMGGAVAVVLLFLEDRRTPLFLSSFLGAVTVTLLELIVGSIALFGFGKRFWLYGRINWQGIIALDWFFKWWGVCLAVLMAKRLFFYWLKKRKEGGNGNPV